MKAIGLMWAESRHAEEGRVVTPCDRMGQKRKNWSQRPAAELGYVGGWVVDVYAAAVDWNTIFPTYAGPHSNTQNYIVMTGSMFTFTSRFKINKICIYQL